MDQLANESLTGFANLLSPTSLHPLVDTNVSGAGASTVNQTTYGINVLHHATAAAATLQNLDPFHGHGHVTELTSMPEVPSLQIGTQLNHLSGHKMIKSLSTLVSVL